jgi:hypothetical protein
MNESLEFPNLPLIGEASPGNDVCGYSVQHDEVVLPGLLHGFHPGPLREGFVVLLPDAYPLIVNGEGLSSQDDAVLLGV